MRSESDCVCRSGERERERDGGCGRKEKQNERRMGRFESLC